MENLLEAIRAAVAPGATDNVKTAGAAACRTILTALEAKSGEPFAPAAPESPPVANTLATAVAMLRGVPPDQLLDLAIAKLRAALPAGADVPAAQPVKFQIIPVQPLAGPPRTP